MARRTYARGRRAWGYDTRTGERTLLRNLVRDGHTGLPVTRRSFEPKHPQETPPRIEDPQALRRPSPDRDLPAHVVTFPTAPWDELWRVYPPLVILFTVGQVTIGGSVGPVGSVYEDDIYEAGVYV